MYTYIHTYVPYVHTYFTALVLEQIWSSARFAVEIRQGFLELIVMLPRQC